MTGPKTHDSPAGRGHPAEVWVRIEYANQAQLACFKALAQQDPATALTHVQEVSRQYAKIVTLLQAHLSTD